jgi:hypothetical protein
MLSELPLSSKVSEFLRPGATCDTSRVPIAPDAVSTTRATASSVAMSRLVARSVKTVRLVAASRNDSVAGDELDQVAQVGADVGEGAGRPALRGVHPPVVISLRQQPVLQVAALNGQQGAEISPGRLAPGLRAPSGGTGRRMALSRSRRQRAAREASFSAWVRLEVASGFSQMTCFPAAIAASAKSKWVALGVQTCTTSIAVIGQEVVDALGTRAGGRVVRLRVRNSPATTMPTPRKVSSR